MNRYVNLILIISIGVGMLGVGMMVWPEWVTGVMSHTSQAATAIHNLVTSLYLATTTTYQGTNSAHQGTSSAHQGTSSNKQKSSSRHRERIFTAQELQQYGSQGGTKGPYLAILGRVYNVKKGKEHYGPGGGYEFFSGRDGSRAFVTGDFTEEGLTDDISGLSSSDYIGLDEWVKFYESDYKYVGKLIGRFYDEKGEPTSQYYDAQRWISEAYRQRESENKEKKMFPPCNSEWTPESGARLWCTNRRYEVSFPVW
ncbi:neuferricin [Cherax quadricarinatus]|uniref:neuferricin n=1 Tax=Cherax quadricarinatus TaxID=27406 RepID=UPI00387E3B9A